MGLLGCAKSWINRGLAPLNMRLESLAAERAEMARLHRLVAADHFDRPAFPVLRQFRECEPGPVVAQVQAFEAQFAKIDSAPGGYRFANDYYPSPDAEVLYAMTRRFAPRRIVEVGSGNSTLLFRHAIADGAFESTLASIDPAPRREIARHADEVMRCRLEDLPSDSIFATLEANDILFVDSSHEIKAGGDVLKLFLSVIPALAPGVVVHVHDVFLPYDYPKRWLVENRWAWTEQYLVQAMLQGSADFEVLWCGYHLQRNDPELLKRFRFWSGANAQSLWLRKRSGA